MCEHFRLGVTIYLIVRLLENVGFEPELLDNGVINVGIYSWFFLVENLQIDINVVSRFSHPFLPELFFLKFR